MEHFLRRALVKIQSESGKRQRSIKEACASVLASLDEDDTSRAGMSPAPTRTSGYRNSHIKPLKEACESGYPKLTEISLDTISKLCAHGYFLDLPVEDDNESEDSNNTNDSFDDCGPNPLASSEDLRSKTFSDIVVKTICNCDVDNDGVQLQMIKALLTVVTSEALEVHGASLLLAVRTIYTICLNTQNSVNKMTAKASLQQLLSYLFQRMEQCDAKFKNSLHPEQFQISDQQADPKIRRSITSEGILSDEVKRSTIRCSYTSIYSEVFEMLKYKYAEAQSDTTLKKDNSSTLDQQVGSFTSVFHKDAYLIFRVLSKLSLNNENISSQKQFASKILSLELLLSILDGAGMALRNNEKFINAVTQYLCVSVLKNCTNSNTVVVELSLKLFVLLSQKYKEHIKTEIEVFITNVFLRILESSNSTFEHKRLVLEVVCNICTIPEELSELFLNYDCDTGAIDLYARIVFALSKASKGRVLNAEAPYSTLLREETQLQYSALQGLVHILTSLLSFFGVSSSQLNITSGGSSDVSETVDLSHEDSTVQKSPLSLENATSQQAGASTLSSSEISGDVLKSNPAAPDSPMPTLVYEFDKKRRLEGELAKGYVQFNLNPMKGLAFFDGKGVLDHSPQGVATFLHSHKDKLDKAAIGEYLAKEKEYKDGFCTKVLHEYVEQLDFTGMRFDEAIRHYLSGFRLPGEAQKIDRMMEKFAERYCLQNPSIFPSADTAFILAFSVIMLNTDLHNPAIREDRRMTKAGFIGNNRGIAAGGNLDEEFLEDIFDRIKANPISLKEDDLWRAKLKVAAGAMETAFSPLYATFTGISLADRAKREAFEKERQDMVQASEALVRQRKMASVSSGRPDFSSSSNIYNNGILTNSDETAQYIRAMFEVAWWPMLGAFSHILKECGDWLVWEEAVENTGGLSSAIEAQHSLERSIIKMCLLGCRYAIRLAALCAERAGSEEAKVARETFINGLAKFTLLDTLAEMNPKNVECIRTLLTIATEDGEYLGESWGSVLRYISQLARLSLLAGNLHTDDVFFSNDGTNSVHSDSSLQKLSNKSNSEFSWVTISASMFNRSTRVNEAAREVEKTNAELISGMIDQLAIDRVFSSSVNLSNAGIHHLVEQLCIVSNQEINHKRQASFRSKDSSIDMSAPRIFSLQRLVEVADFNMDSRSRIVWAEIWGILSEHFAAIGSHENPQVAMYAIDSLRQLAHKFTAKEELRDFNFQRLFMKPFESMMANSPRTDIREFVLQCVEYLMRSRLPSIRSGWKSIFSVYAVAAKDPSDSIAKMAWRTVDDVTKKHIESLTFDFLELIKCLLAFVEGPREDLALHAINMIGYLTKYLGPASELKIAEPSNHSHSKRDRSAPNNPDSIRLWWPILFGLSENVGNVSLSLRHACLNVLWNVLAENGGIFSTQTWELLFKGVLFPMMENAAIDMSDRNRSCFPESEFVMTGIDGGWVVDTAPKVLQICCELYFLHENVTRPLLPELLGLLQSCICQSDEILARMGVEGLTNFMIKLEENERSNEGAVESIVRPDDTGVSIAKKFTVWDCLSASLSVILIDNLPAEILESNWCEPCNQTFSCAELSPGVSPTGYQRGIMRESSREIDDRKPNLDALMTMLVVGIRLLPLIEGIICCQSDRVKFSSDNLRTLIEAIESSAKVCRRFNNNFALRRFLGSLGFMTPDSTSRKACKCLKQEVRSYEALLRCVNFLGGAREGNESIIWEDTPCKARKMCKIILLMYSAREKKSRELSRGDAKAKNDAELMKEMVMSLDGVVIEALKVVQSWNDTDIRVERDWVYDSLVGLITSDSLLVREQVHVVFLTRISGLVHASGS